MQALLVDMRWARLATPTFQTHARVNALWHVQTLAQASVRSTGTERQLCNAVSESHRVELRVPLSTCLIVPLLN